jgi:lysophospholipid acyltransferase (LPLAT)-like uncharacterized protein
MIKLAGRVGGTVVRMWMSTVRCHLDSEGRLTDPRDPSLKEKYIYALWHDSLFLVPTIRCDPAKGAALISKSNDGELLAQICAGGGLRTIRGSSSRGGMDAVDEVMALEKKIHLLVAPDGPRGPRHQVKRGLIYLAAWTGMPIVPLGVGFQNCWRAKSWDRTAIPKPWSRMTCVSAPIIRVPPNVGKRAIEDYRSWVEESMFKACEKAEAWAKGIKVSVAWPILPPAAAA